MGLCQITVKCNGAEPLVMSYVKRQVKTPFEGSEVSCIVPVTVPLKPVAALAEIEAEKTKPIVKTSVKTKLIILLPTKNPPNIYLHIYRYLYYKFIYFKCQ